MKWARPIVLDYCDSQCSRPCIGQIQIHTWMDTDMDAMKCSPGVRLSPCQPCSCSNVLLLSVSTNFVCHVRCTHSTTRLDWMLVMNVSSCERWNLRRNYCERWLCMQPPWIFHLWIVQIDRHSHRMTATGINDDNQIAWTFALHFKM